MNAFIGCGLANAETPITEKNLSIVKDIVSDINEATIRPSRI